MARLADPPQSVGIHGTEEKGIGRAQRKVDSLKALGVKKEKGAARSL
jgi:hypothetical protein